MDMKRIKRSLWAAPCLAIALGLAAPAAQAVTIFALFDDEVTAAAGAPEDNNLFSFDSATPGTVTPLLPITGLIDQLTGEKLVGIDFRVGATNNGTLYGVTDSNRVYTLNTTTGVATQVGAVAFTPVLAGNAITYGLDFNPVVDRIRVVGEGDENLRLNPDTGLVVGGVADSPLAFAAGDSGLPGTPEVTAAAYTNNTVGAATTTLFGIDRIDGTLVRIGNPDPNLGETVTVGTGLGVLPANENVGFDIATVGAVNTAFAAITNSVGNANELYTINLVTGAATLVGTIGTTGGDQTIGIAAVPQQSVQFSAATTTVAETGPNAVLTVTRTGGTTGTASVTINTADGTALAASDYTALVGTTVTFVDGDASETVNVPITDDPATEGDETFTATLSAPTNGAVLGATTVNTVTISANDAPAGAVQFDAATTTAAEGGNAVLTVTRTGGTAGAIAVTVATADGTATVGSDFTAPAATVNFAAGDATPQTVTVPITDDTDTEGDEIFTVTLSAPTGGATLGAPATNTVTIPANDAVAGGGPGTVAFAAATSTVAENAGNATITVTRTDTTGAAMVDFATSSGTATSGADFTGTTGTLTFMAGVASETIPVPVTNDSTIEFNETFTVVLSNATGATLGTPATHTVTITSTLGGGGSGGGGGGGGGGGCSLSLTSNGTLDPTLPVMMLVAGLYLMRRRLGWKA